ncbi:diguanylate cyclase [Paraburkholderia kururiensis]|uniref:putative bifunctional diguanylate cyclase/phosphodiesterase n=1 Tax=Paraburkholderia kururiensis TaxID=984307 RepID=UPI0039A6588B
MIATLQKRLAGSARLRFVSISAVIAGLFLLSFVVVCFQLTRIISDANRIDNAWITNTRLLGEVSDRLTELRLSQALLMLAPQPESRTAAKVLAAGHRRVLDENKKAFLANEASRSLLPASKAFAAVDAYASAERRWEEGFNDEATRRRFESDTKERYEAADKAIDALIEANANAAHADTARITETSRLLFTVVAIIGALVCGLTIVAIRRLDTVLFHPLQNITSAMVELSSGHEGVKLPLLERKDEIGGLAKAFQRFRHNAEALREAYVATKLAEESAARLARHDPLTGLFNRRFLCNCIDDLVATSDNKATNQHYLYVIDLDRFKPVNDLHGHAAGDAVLCEISRRLRGLVRQDDVVARLGGDEFAVLAHVDSDDADLAAAFLAARMDEAIRSPLQIGACEIEVGGSIGVARLWRDGHDSNTLVRSADVAMYYAKSRSNGGFQFFEGSMREALRKQAELETDVRAAVAHHTIEPHYQPLVDLSSDRICGFEVLARWTHPKHGTISPDIFIPVIERLGLSTTFTLSMLRRACRHVHGWPPHLTLALNLSPRQLVDPLLPAQILSTLREEEFPPERLEIEMTESALVGDLDAAKNTIGNFRKWGIGVSLDDFGTGYSSLHHLRELRFDKVKIDKSFVRSMLSDPESGKIVDAILSLSEGLGLRTLAEGIETPELETALRARGCSFGQGYLFGRAISARDVPALLESNVSGV